MGNRYKNSPKKNTPVIKCKRARLINILGTIVLLSLMALLGLLCIQGRPLWLITTVLLINIVFLTLAIIFDPPRGFPQSDEKVLKVSLIIRNWLLLGNTIFLVCYWLSAIKLNMKIDYDH